MAVSTNSYFHNALPGIAQLGGAFNKFASDTSPKYAVGTRVCVGEGDVYVYSHFGAATDRGLLVAQDLSESAVVETDNVIIAPASAVTTTDGTAGSRFIEITLASVTADMFAGGYLHTTDDTGEGYCYRIKGNTATNDPASGNFRLELYEPLAAAVTSDTDFAITGSMYANLEGATAGTDYAIAGVSCATQAAADYGWVQVAGVATVLQDGTIAAGDMLTLSDGVTGAVQTAAGGGTAITDLVAEQIVGYALFAGDNTGHVGVKLSIE